jgi:hypothetical protein
MLSFFGAVDGTSRSHRVTTQQELDTVLELPALKMGSSAQVVEIMTQKLDVPWQLNEALALKKAQAASIHVETLVAKKSTGLVWTSRPRVRNVGDEISGRRTIGTDAAMMRMRLANSRSLALVSGVHYNSCIRNKSALNLAAKVFLRKV